MRIVRISALIVSVLILSAGAAKADGTELFKLSGHGMKGSFTVSDTPNVLSDEKNRDFTVETPNLMIDGISFGPQLVEFLSASEGGGLAMDVDGFWIDLGGKQLYTGAEFAPTLTGKGGTTLHMFGWAVDLNVIPAATPEPATLILLGSGLLGFAAFRRRRASSK
jgi:hypothetical protein